MKKLFFSRSLLMVLLMVITSVFLTNCSPSKSSDGTLNKKQAAKWYNSHKWLNGLQLIPNESIDQQEFSKQYHKNRIWWDEAFEFMKTHDLLNLTPGIYIIDSGNVIATVSEGPAIDIDQVKWESHRRFNDLQYIIKGKARMGIASVSDPNSIVSVPYSTDRDTENFTVNGGKYYDAGPGTFFIFSPLNIHRPSIKIAGYDVIKKIVIKVRVP